MSYFPKPFEHFYLTSPLSASLVPGALADAAGPYWLEFRKVSDYTFRIRRAITYKNLFAHLFKSVMTVTICSYDNNSCLEVEIKPHLLYQVFFVLWVLFLTPFLIWALVTLNPIAGLFGIGASVFAYLVLAIRLQIDSEIFTGFLDDVLSASDRKES